MTNLHQVLQAIVTVLAVINPVVCGSLFLTLTQATVTRFMGLMVSSMGIQFVLVGLKAFFET
jgi:small neutral amino acid transporter SnatA (MarC family)